MIYAYLRISSDNQSVDNQHYEILKFADQKKLSIDTWIKETVSSTRKVDQRKLGSFLEAMQNSDVLIVSELSRLGRNLMEVMSIQHICMEKEVKVFTIKENYELGNNRAANRINSKVLAFAFGLSAEIERQLISQRTKEALARKRSEGKTLGRPKGSLSKQTKLSGKEGQIRELLSKKVSYSAIGRILGVNRMTVKQFAENRGLNRARTILI